MASVTTVAFVASHSPGPVLMRPELAWLMPICRLIQRVSGGGDRINRLLTGISSPGRIRAGAASASPSEPRNPLRASNNNRPHRLSACFREQLVHATEDMRDQALGDAQCCRMGLV